MLSLLLALFSFALLLHFGIVIKTPKTVFVLLLLSLVQFIYPRLWFLSIIAILISLRTFLFDFPRQANHANIETFIAVILIGTVVYRYCTGKRPSNNAITGCFRWTLIGIYFWAGFHKINEGFLAESGSCASYISGRVGSLLSLESSMQNLTVLRITQTSTLLLELVLPFGILFNKTRKATVIILVLFHFYLCLCNFSNFSALAGFLIVGSVIDLNRPNKALKLGFKIYQALALIAIFISYLATSPETYKDTPLLTNIIFAVGWLALFVPLLINRSLFVETGRKYSVIQGLLVMLCISIWAIQPYVGLSNTANLSMFSNLVTEQSRSNHYLVNTKYTKIFNLEEDYVTVLNAPKNSNHFIGYDLPTIEFLRKVSPSATKFSEDVGEWVVMYRGVVLQNNDFDKLTRREWWHRYLVFRQIPREGQNECLW